MKRRRQSASEFARRYAEIKASLQASAAISAAAREPDKQQRHRAASDHMRQHGAH
jgi:hypothetical protein